MLLREDYEIEHKQCTRSAETNKFMILKLEKRREIKTGKKDRCFVEKFVLNFTFWIYKQGWAQQWADQGNFLGHTVCLLTASRGKLCGPSMLSFLWAFSWILSRARSVCYHNLPFFAIQLTHQRWIFAKKKCHYLYFPKHQ